MKFLVLRFEFLLLAGAVVLTAVHSLWWLFLSVPLAVWCATQIGVYFGRPWRRFHFPVSREVLPKALAIETHEAHEEGREYDEERMLSHLVAMVRGGQKYPEAESFVESAISEEAFQLNVRLLCQEVRGRMSGKAEQDDSRLVEECAGLLKKRRASLKKLFVMAALVGERYGEQERGEYIFQALKGEAF